MSVHPISVFSWITVALWCALAIYLSRGARVANADIERGQKASLWLRLVKLAVMLYVFALIYVPRLVGVRETPMTGNLTGNAALGAAGAAVCAFGVYVFIAARRTLGRNWSDLVVLKRDHRLVESGPYRWVRHPLYAGLLLALLGSAMTVNTPVAYIIVPLGLPGIWVKARREEALLEQRFPEYRSYRRRVKALIPYVL